MAVNWVGICEINYLYWKENNAQTNTDENFEDHLKKKKEKKIE